MSLENWLDILGKTSEASSNDLINYCNLYRRIPDFAIGSCIHITKTDAQEKSLLCRRYMYLGTALWLEYLFGLRREPPTKTVRKHDGNRGNARCSKALFDLLQMARLHPDLEPLREIGTALQICFACEVEAEIESLYSLGILGSSPINGDKTPILQAQNYAFSLFDLEQRETLTLKHLKTLEHVNSNKSGLDFYNNIMNFVVAVAYADSEFYSRCYLPYLKTVKSGLYEVEKDKKMVFIPCDRKGRSLGLERRFRNRLNP